MDGYIVDKGLFKDTSPVEDKLLFDLGIILSFNSINYKYY